jgi:hypothetical protein
MTTSLCRLLPLRQVSLFTNQGDYHANNYS